MKKKGSITYKITGLLLALSLSSLLLIGGVSAFSLQSMKRISEENSRELGQTAAEDAERALENVTGQRLKNTAIQKAEFIEEKFSVVMSYVHGIAAQAEEIYAQPGKYPDREVALPEKGSTKLAAQLLWSEKLSSPGEREQAEILKLGNLQDLLVQYNANNNMVSSAYLATKSGWMIQADYIAGSKYEEGADAPMFYEAEDRQWFQRALRARKGEIVYSDVIADVHAGGNCIVCAQPVFKDGKVVAVAGIGFYLKAINETVLNTTIGQSGYAFLINQEGKIIVSPKTEGETAAGPEESRDLRLSENPELAESVKDVLSGGNGLKKMTLDGRPVYLAYAPLENLGWGFLTVMDVQEVVAPAMAGQKQILELSRTVVGRQDYAIRTTLLFFAAILAVTAMLTGIAGTLFGRRLTEPIRRLTADVVKIGNGNLDYKIEISTGDEVEELGDTFNAMTEKLREYIQNLASVTIEKERIQTELKVAARIQKDMLPDAEELRHCREFTLAASMTPAKEVGGDFYDFFLLDENRLAVIVADVSGKGVPAALFMMVAKSRLRACMMAEASLERAMEKANENLCANNGNNMFVTAWAGILDLSDGTLTYVNAGHCRPLVKHGKGDYVYLKEQGGFVLAGMPNMKYSQSVITLSPGDVLFQYSDGVVETNDISGNLYGEERLESLVNREKKETPGQLLSAVWADIQDFQGSAEQFDDITMLSLRYHGRDTEKRLKGPADIGRMREVMNFVEKSLEKENFPKKETAQILVAVDEMFSNICYYSGAQEVEVMCGVTEEEAKICFSDNGIPYNPLEKTDPDLKKEAHERPIGGLGIYIVKKTMDAVHYEYRYAENRNYLTIIKERQD